MMASGVLVVVKSIAPSNVVDNDAVAIGDLYQKARGSLVDSVRYSIECGQRLDAKKGRLEHGEWLPWLEANADVLGFSNDSTARRLMTLARENSNRALAHDLDEATAIDLSRKTWGHQRPKSLATLQNVGTVNGDDTVIDDAPLSRPSDEETRRIYESAPIQVRSAVDAYLSLTRRERDAAWQLINLYDQ